MSGAKHVFTTEEMTSDPEPKAPTINMVEEEEDEPAKTEELRSDAWFNTNKITRVPVIALEPDMYQIDNQAYACFSIIRPEDYGVLHHGDKGYKGFLIKFRGVFPNKEEADRHIRKIMRIDRHFDVHLVPCFQWAKMDEDDCSEREHLDDNIGEIMKGYFKQENDRMKGVRKRISDTEEGYETRSKDVTDYFHSIENAPPVPLLPSKPDSRAVTLDELADELGIEGKGETIVSQELGDMDTERFRAIVSEVILEDEEEIPKATKKEKLSSLEDDDE